MGGYFTFNVKAIAMRIAKIINLMYFCITTTPFREWHNRRPPFFRRKAEPKNLKQKELSFKLRMKSCPAGMTPGRLYYTAKKPICQYRFRRRERLFYASFPPSRIWRRLQRLSSLSFLFLHNLNPPLAKKVGFSVIWAAHSRGSDDAKFSFSS